MGQYFRQFRLMLQSRALSSQGLGQEEIARRLGQRGFVVAECLRQGHNFSLEALEQALRDCLEADVSVKTGRMGDKLAVETLIIRYAG